VASWGGKGSVEFEVERKLVGGKPVPLEDDDDNVEIVMIMLRVSGSASFTSGRKSGPADLCYDDEGEQEIEEVVRLHKGREESVGVNFLTEEEQEEALEMICEEIQSNEGPDYEPDDNF